MGDNTSLVRRAFELFNARDLEGLSAIMAPDGELFPYAIEDQRSIGYHGHEGLRQYLGDVDTLFESFQVEITEVRDVTEDVVLASGFLHGKTRTGDQLDMPAGWLWTVRDGVIARMQAHPDAE